MMIEFDTIYKISPNYRTDGGGMTREEIVARGGMDGLQPEYNIIVSSFLLVNGNSFPLFDLLGKRFHGKI